MIKIAPSILSADFADIAAGIALIEKWGAEYIHCDVMDGMFVPNISFGPKMIADIRKRTRLTLDVHLMVQAPERYIDQFAAAGADIITVHQEACLHLHRTLTQIKAAGKKCGVVLNPATSIHTIEDVLDDVDMVLLMSVNPGFGGQAFIPSALNKARRLKEMLGGRNVDIEMDGGISGKNAAEVAGAGVNVLVAGSALFGSADPQAEMGRLRCLR